jgi:amidase
MLATIKPTVGRISHHGILPLTADQDTAGPMGAHRDVAILMGVLGCCAGHGPATKTCAPPPATAVPQGGAQRRAHRRSRVLLRRDRGEGAPRSGSRRAAAAVMARS